MEHMTNIGTVKQLCESIWKIEQEFGLLDVEIHGVKIWQALRMELYYDIAQKLELLDAPRARQSGKKYKVKYLLSFLNSSIFYNPFFDFTKKEVLVFDHARKVLVDGKYIDIYTHYMIEDLKEKGPSFEVYEQSYLDQHFGKPDGCRKHLDFIRVITKIYSLLPIYRFPNEDVSLVKIIEERLFEDLGIELDLLNRFQKYVKRFKVQYTLFKKLFELKCPEVVYVVVSYGLAPIIKAAKDKGVEVIELQHGVFSDYHLGYSFPSTAADSLDYFPDRLLVWDDYWRRMCKLPLSPNKIAIKRFSFFDKKYGEFKHVKRKEKQIIVISQGVIGSKLADIILKNISDLQEYKIIYKLHPGEYGRWRDYPSLVKLESFSNVNIIDTNDVSLYRLLAESKYVIGVFSTALFEALDFNCALFIVDLPGVEYMQNLISDDKAIFIGDKLRIRDALKVA